MRIEDRLQLAKRFVQRPVLAGYKLRTAQPITMLAANRPPQLEQLLVQIAGQAIHPFDISPVGQVQQRTQVQLAVPCMPKQRRGDLVFFQDVNHLGQKLGQGFRRYGHVLHKRQGTRRSLQTVQGRHDFPRQFPVKIDIGRVQGDPRADEMALGGLQPAEHHADAVLDRCHVVPVKLHQQYRLGFGRNQQIKPHVTFPRQAQVTPINQVAGAGLHGQHFRHGPRRLIQPVKQEEDYPAGRRQGINA